jgi:hypothetical protein
LTVLSDRSATHGAEAKAADARKWESPWGARIAAAKCDVRFSIIGEPWDYTDAINDFHPMGAPIADGSAVEWHEVLVADSADEYVSPL